MSVYWNSRTRALEPYVPGEQPRDRKYIKLNTNENPYPPSPATLAAIAAATGESLRLYPDPTCLELRSAIAARYGTKPERVFVGNGSDEILAFAFGAFFEPALPSAKGAAAAGRSGAPVAGGSVDGQAGASGAGRPALPVRFPDITYSFYPVYADLWDVPVETPALGDDFSVKPEDYLAPSGGVVLPNPNAPTGRALPVRDLLRIAEAQAAVDAVVIVDEAYVDFGAESVLPAIAEYPNLLAVHTLSKSRSLAGLRVGFAIGQEELIEGLVRVRDSFNSYTVDRLAQAGAAAAVADAAYYDRANRAVAATRDRAAAALGELGFRGPRSAANFLFVSHPAIPGETLFAALRARGILVRHFRKPRISEYLRISVGDDEAMDALIAACADILKEQDE